MQQDEASVWLGCCRGLHDHSNEWGEGFFIDKLAAARDIVYVLKGGSLAQSRRKREHHKAA